MGRGRIIRPDFWTDSQVVGLSPYARLLYIGTWNYALCDRGHLVDDAKKLRFQILPADNVDADVLLDELLDAGVVTRIVTESGTFLFLPLFERDQTASKDSRWASRCPVCRLSQTQESFTEPIRDIPRSPEIPVEGEASGVGDEVEVEGEREDAPPSLGCTKHPNGTESPCGPCRTARIRREAWDINHKPTKDDRARATLEMGRRLDAQDARRRLAPRVELSADYCPTHHLNQPCPVCDGSAVPALERSAA